MLLTIVVISYALMAASMFPGWVLMYSLLYQMLPLNPCFSPPSAKWVNETFQIDDNLKVDWGDSRYLLRQTGNCRKKLSWIFFNGSLYGCKLSLSDNDIIILTRFLWLLYWITGHNLLFTQLSRKFKLLYHPLSHHDASYLISKYYFSLFRGP